jgi:hypothetical protein
MADHSANPDILPHAAGIYVDAVNYYKDRASANDQENYSRKITGLDNQLHTDSYRFSQKYTVLENELAQYEPNALSIYEMVTDLVDRAMTINEKRGEYNALKAVTGSADGEGMERASEILNEGQIFANLNIPPHLRDWFRTEIVERVVNERNAAQQQRAEEAQRLAATEIRTALLGPVTQRERKIYAHKEPYDMAGNLTTGAHQELIEGLEEENYRDSKRIFEGHVVPGVRARGQAYVLNALRSNAVIGVKPEDAPAMEPASAPAPAAPETPMTEPRLGIVSDPPPVKAEIDLTRRPLSQPESAPVAAPVPAPEPAPVATPDPASNPQPAPLETASTPDDNPPVAEQEQLKLVDFSAVISEQASLGPRTARDILHAFGTAYSDSYDIEQADEKFASAIANLDQVVDLNDVEALAELAQLATLYAYLSGDLSLMEQAMVIAINDPNSQIAMDLRTIGENVVAGIAVAKSTHPDLFAEKAPAPGEEAGREDGFEENINSTVRNAGIAVAGTAATGVMLWRKYRTRQAVAETEAQKQANAPYESRRAQNQKDLKEKTDQRIQLEKERSELIAKKLTTNPEEYKAQSKDLKRRINENKIALDLLEAEKAGLAKQGMASDERKEPTLGKNAKPSTDETAERLLKRYQRLGHEDHAIIKAEARGNTKGLAERKLARDEARRILNKDIETFRKNGGLLAPDESRYQRAEKDLASSPKELLKADTKNNDDIWKKLDKDRVQLFEDKKANPKGDFAAREADIAQRTQKRLAAQERLKERALLIEQDSHVSPDSKSKSAGVLGTEQLKEMRRGYAREYMTYKQQVAEFHNDVQKISEKTGKKIGDIHVENPEIVKRLNKLLSEDERLKSVQKKIENETLKLRTQEKLNQYPASLASESKSAAPRTRLEEFRQAVGESKIHNAHFRATTGATVALGGYSIYQRFNTEAARAELTDERTRAWAGTGLAVDAGITALGTAAALKAMKDAGASVKAVQSGATTVEALASANKTLGYASKVKFLGWPAALAVGATQGFVDYNIGMNTGDAKRAADGALNAVGGTAGAIAGAAAGGAVGAKTGATVGAAIGVWFGGIGAVPGAAAGAAIGGFIGMFGGGYAGAVNGADAARWAGSEKVTSWTQSRLNTLNGEKRYQDGAPATPLRPNGFEVEKTQVKVPDAKGLYGTDVARAFDTANQHASAASTPSSTPVPGLNSRI